MADVIRKKREDSIRTTNRIESCSDKRSFSKIGIGQQGTDYIKAHRKRY